MVAGNMKFITHTNVDISKTKLQNSNNVLLITSSTLKPNTNNDQEVASSNVNGSLKMMRYYNGNNYKKNDSVQSLQTPKQCGSNRSGKKTHSHMLYNIPTTSDLNRKKYYQQYQHHNQKQHKFLNSSKGTRNNVALKNQNSLVSEASSSTDALVCCVQNEKISEIGNSLTNVEDFVNNNTAILAANTTFTPTNSDVNCADLIVDNSTALSSHRAEAELEQHSAPISANKIAPILIASETTLIGQHNCVDENTTINLDCNSCWSNLVHPQCSDPQTLLTWPWVHISRRKSSSVSSASSYSSAASSSVSAPRGSNAEFLQNTNVEYINNLDNTHSKKKQIFRKGNTNNNKKGKLFSYLHIEEQHQRAISNGVRVTDDSQNIKCSSVVSADEVSFVTENQKAIYSTEDHIAKKTAMTTALATDTISATTTTATTVDSTIKIIATKNENFSEKCTSNAATITVTSPSSISANGICSLEELTESSIFPGTITPSTVATSKVSDYGSSFTSTLTTSSNLPTSSTPGPPSPNSYSLDFLHSVGVQMTGGTNLTALCKTSAANMCTENAFIDQDTSVAPPLPSTHNSYSSYQNVLPQRSHPVHGRFMNSGGEVGLGSSNITTGAHPKDQRGHRFHQHYHYPQQLTIASFIQQEFLNENFFGGGNSRCSNNGNNSVNGSADINNNNGNYRNNQRRNYYTTQHQQSQQQRVPGAQHRYPTLQPTYRYDIENDGTSRGTRNRASTNSQFSKQQMYPNVKNNPNNLDVKPNEYQSHPVHNQSIIEDAGSCGHSGGTENVSASSANNLTNNSTLNNLHATKQSQRKLLSNKIPNCTSNATSLCSSSSSSASSNSSQASSTSYRQQRAKSQTQMNLVIETLPRKINTPSHRINHRLQQFNYHNQHHSQHYLSSVGVALSSASQQPHQNVYNLTYVNTENLTQFPNVCMGTTATSRSCSPSLHSPTPGTPGCPEQQEAQSSMVLAYTPSNIQSQQHQQNVVHDKLTPFTMNISPAHSVSSPTASSITVGNMVCYTQLKDSGTSCDSVQPTNNVAATLNHDYEDSDSSSTNSVAVPQSHIEYHQVKSVSHSSSSSASSSSSLTARTQQEIDVLVNDMSQLHNPDSSDFVYNPTSVSSSQRYTTQSQPLALAQQQQSPFHRNGAITMFNVPVNNRYTEDDLCSIKQQLPQHQKVNHQQQHFYFTSGEHLNATSLTAHSGNGGYWSPLQHSNFLYPQPASFIPAASCPTPTVTLSPCLSDHDDHNHNYHQLPRQQLINIASQTEAIPPLNSLLKRSSGAQMAGGTILAQQPHQQYRMSQSNVSQGNMVTSASSVASLRHRSGGRNQQSSQHRQLAAPPPMTSIPHIYPQHNLLYSGPQTQIRPSVNSNHDFFTHTPPDRFLARAHLIEAKEAPNTLLNDSKWDNLSQHVWDKFISSQQTEETFKQKMRLWRYLYIIIKNTYPRFGLYLVGSTISGFGADTSDVDMCLVSRSTSNVEPRMEALFNLTVLRDYLSKSAEFENFNLIEAKVPILRFRDHIHRLEVDLNFNNCVGIKNTHLLYCYSQLDWRLRPMVLVTKLWAQYHNINNAKNMTISSYSLVLMVIHFLQYAVSPAVLPCLHDLFPDKFPLLRSNDFGYVDMNETIGPCESKNTQTIGELFLHFLEYYSCFDYTQFAISIRTGGLLPINVCRLAKSSKNDIHQWKELCIEEPFDLTNTARSVYDFETFERVKAIFVTSWRILQQTLDLNSIFAPIIIPTTNRAATTLEHTDSKYDDSDGCTSSAISTNANTTHVTANGSGIVLDEDIRENECSAVTLAPLSKDINKHLEELTRSNTNRDSKTAGGALKELVS